MMGLIAKKNIAMVLFLMMAVCCVVSMGTVYKVGDSAGWTTIGNIDYIKWASTRNFHVGDTLVFQYHVQLHNVMEVSRSDFHRCNATHPLATYTTGNDSISLMWPGHYFYLCGFPGHCQAGQKVDIRVPRSPSPSISPSPPPHGPAATPAVSSSGLIGQSPSQNSAVPSSLLSSNIWCLMISKLGLSLIVIVVCVSGFVY